ncbi:hypothetical protein EHS25_000685 [Saitozyma podzolica]|uniref:Uncharacterized protein n=1 Tax=Saitozyma podzolica TaxID=1890683 RepID=A0A427YWS4_9TREE|nr:hypothetical protein EHS25_000685 [Saitozyma podzolica]
MSEGTNSHHDTSTSSGTSGITASSRTGLRSALSALSHVYEKVYSDLGVNVSRYTKADGSGFGAMFLTPDIPGGAERGRLLGMDFRPIPQDSISDQGRGQDSGASTGEYVRPRMIGSIIEIGAEDPYLTYPTPLATGQDVSDFRSERAYFGCLKLGLESAGIYLAISPTTGAQLQTLAPLDGSVRPAVQLLSRLFESGL